MFRLPGRIVPGGFLGVAAVLVLSTSAMAAPIRWSEAVDLGYARGWGLLDADFSGKSLALVWAARWADPSAVTLRSSADGGATFSRRVTFEGASAAAVAVCGAEVDVAYTHKVSSQRWQIVHASGTTGSASGFTTQVVAGGRGIRSEPDVACANGRVFVSWYEGTATDFELYIASALRSDGIFGPPIHLASDHREHRRGLAIAASGDRAYAVYGLPRDPDLYLKSWTIGPGPDYKLTGHPLRLVAHHPKGWGAIRPAIDADGKRVAVVWNGCMHPMARVSSDAGQTWGKRYGGSWCPKKGDHVDGGSGADFIDINGDAVVLTATVEGLGGSAGYIVVTHDSFTTVSEHTLWEAGWWGAEQVSRVGWVKIGQRVVLADMLATRRHIYYQHRA